MWECVCVHSGTLGGKTSQNVAWQKYFIICVIFLILEIQSQFYWGTLQKMIFLKDHSNIRNKFWLYLLTFWMLNFSIRPTTFWGARSYFWLPIACYLHTEAMFGQKKSLDPWTSTATVFISPQLVATWKISPLLMTVFGSDPMVFNLLVKVKHFFQI